MKSAIAMQPIRSRHYPLQTSRRQLCRLAWLVSLIFALPIAALAQTSAPAPLPPEAQAAVDKGVVAAKQQDYLLAVRYFQDARKLAPKAPEVFYDLGLAESKMPGRELRAICWFGAYLVANPDASNAAAVKNQIEVLDVKSQSNLSRLIKTVQDTAEKMSGNDRAGARGRVAALWVEAGDTASAFKVVDRIQSEDGRVDSHYVLEMVSEAQAKVDDILGARRTANSIQDLLSRIRSLTTIAGTQARAGDMAGAQETFSSAMKNADTLQPEQVDKSSVLCDVARAQAWAGDMVNAKTTFASALKNVSVSHGNFDTMAEIYKIAYTQAAVYYVSDAQKTADLLRDDADNKWKTGAQEAITRAQETIKLGLGIHHVHDEPLVAPVTDHDWLHQLDEDTASMDCALNTDPFLDLASYLTAQHSDDPGKLFNVLKETAEKIIKAQNVIDKMLKQEAAK
jgi:tetratricopeptide (TPR) repeat protein